MKPGNKPKLIYLLLAVIFLLSACNDIIEPSVEKKQVQPEAPADNYQSTSYTINFWWDEIDHANAYRLQIVTATFESPGNLALDTLIKKNTFSFNLSPGKYQWRVLGQNASSQTDFSAPRSLEIEASSIKQQSVQLSSPGNNFITNQSNLIFQWGGLYGATKYRFQIDTNNFSNESVIVSNIVVPGEQLNYTLQSDHAYQWRVRAENDTALAQWSKINNLIYDHIAPPAPGLTSPTKGQTVSLPVSLQWATVPSATKYKLYVLKSDSTSLYNNTFPVISTTTNYSFNLGAAGDKIYWKVAAIDAAGNEGQASETRRFSLQ